MTAGKMLSSPRILLAAARARRRLRHLGALPPAEALAFARSFSWYGDSLRPTQADDEILWLLDLLREERPHAIVELGLDRGGTLFLWSRVAADDAVLVAVDMRPLGRLGQRSPFALVRKAIARRGQRVDLIMAADSHDPATVARVRRALRRRPVDFLFVDGDHSYDGVRRDFELYAPLVRPGGIVAFHDVTGGDEPDVVRFWNELKARAKTTERTAAEPPRYGIGVYRTPVSEPGQAYETAR